MHAMNSFNLIDEPWIPVRDLNGANRLVGLETLFCEASSIADLDCPPHERISLMRLLVCITQAELGAPESAGDWNGFGDDMETRIPAYLKRLDIHPYFNLFGEGPRFLQVSISADSEPVSASKLVPHLATGNNPTLLDHEGGNESRTLAPARLATALLAFQCFYPLYGAGYKGKGPCVDGNMVHTLVVGKNLKESILSNCLTSEWINDQFGQYGMGKPIWELNPSADDFESIATRSYLGRQVPRHRNLQLLDDGTGFLLQKEGLEYPRFEESREPTATVVVITKNNAQERRLLPARLDKAVWRDLHTLTVLRHGRGEEARAPLNLQAQWQRMGAEVQIWVGALVTDLKAKIHDTMESSITIPSVMFDDVGHSRYEAGVAYADAQSNQLYGAVKQYGATMKNESPPTDEAKQHYWNALEQKSKILLEIVRHPEVLQGQSFGEGNDSWTSAVRAAARAAYEHVCPRQTPRQLQAYAAGLKVLPLKSAKKKSTPTPVAV